MPCYEYECGSCGADFEAIRPLADRNEPCPCPHCPSGRGARVYLTPPPFTAFVGSDRLRSRVDSWANMVEDAQREGVQSQTEIEVGIGQAHDRAAKLGIPVERILGYKGQKPKLTEEIKRDMKKRARDQEKLVKR